MFSIAVFYLLQQLTHLDVLAPILGCFVFAAIAILLRKLKGLTLWLTVSFLVVGAILMIIRGADARDWFQAASINVTLVTLFLFAPLFGIPVRLPKYVQALKRFYEGDLRSKTGLFAGTQLLTQIMAVFINVGSIPVVYGMVFVKPRAGMSMLLANALNRGFAGAIFWSPYFAAMTLVTSSLHLSWWSVAPYTFGLALLSLLISWTVELRQLRHATDPLPQDAAFGATGVRLRSNRSRFRIKERRLFRSGLGIYLIAAILLLLILESTLQLPIVLLICMAAAAPSSRLVHHQRSDERLQEWPEKPSDGYVPLLAEGDHVVPGCRIFQRFNRHDRIRLPGAIIAGAYPAACIPYLLDIYSGFNCRKSIVGLHPIVPVTILATGIDPFSMQMSPICFAVLLLGGWGLSNPISPASAVNNLLAGLLKRTVFEVAAPNYKFAGCMAVVLILYSIIVGYLI